MNAPPARALLGLADPPRAKLLNCPRKASSKTARSPLVPPREARQQHDEASEPSPGRGHCQRYRAPESAFPFALELSHAGLRNSFQRPRGDP
jgi:hypothetical protein